MIIFFIVILLHLSTDAKELFSIEGSVLMTLDKYPNDWKHRTKIILESDDHMGFLKEDGSFVLSNLSPGSYVLEVVNPDITFEQIRVDISKNGKIRGRRVNNLQPNLVSSVAYPLKLKSLFLTQYFQAREKMRITDFLLNPMVLMMVLPLLVIMVIPKLMNSMDIDPAKELQSANAALSSTTGATNQQYDVPDLSEMMTNAFHSLTGGQRSSSHLHSNPHSASSPGAAATYAIKQVTHHHTPASLPSPSPTSRHLNTPSSDQRSTSASKRKNH